VLTADELAVLIATELALELIATELAMLELPGVGDGADEPPPPPPPQADTASVRAHSMPKFK